MGLRRRTVAFLSTCLLGCLCTAAGCGGDDGARPQRELLWSDEFDGARGAPPSPDRWTHDTGGSGWGNAELQCYTTSPRNAATDGDGHLVITAEREPTTCEGAGANQYSSARLTTIGTFSFTFGRVEARMKMPSGVGTWPALWALGSDLPTVGWPEAGELDVVEYLPRDPQAASGTVHGPTADGQHWYLHRGTRAGVDLSQAFHTYAMEWTADRVDFYLDDTLFGTVTKEQALQRGMWRADRPHHLLLNLAVGGTLGGEVPATTVWPQRLIVDYVRVYR